MEFNTQICTAKEQSKRLSEDLFPEITFENSPKKIKIEVL